MANVPVKRLEIAWNPYAECNDCGWERERGPDTPAAAKTHVRSTGHEVRIVRESVSVWAPKKEPE